MQQVSLTALPDALDQIAEAEKDNSNNVPKVAKDIKAWLHPSRVGCISSTQQEALKNALSSLAGQHPGDGFTTLKAAQAITHFAIRDCLNCSTENCTFRVDEKK